MADVAIVAAGMGNIGSVANMCRKLGLDASVVSDPAGLEGASRILLPGVGAFDFGMQLLESSGLLPVLHERVRDGVPVLGICLGMQLLFDGSDEGGRAGLGWLGGRVRRLPGDTPAGTVRVPHMGWNTVEIVRPMPLLDSVSHESRFYFVHSYAPCPDDEGTIAGVTSHGAPFASVVGRDNVMGVQFHPEKSHRHGMALLRSFLEA